MGCGNYISVHTFLKVCLTTNVLVESGHCGLDGLNNMTLELKEGVLNSNEIIAIVIFLENLFVEAMVDTALDDVGIIGGFYFAGTSVKCSGMLTKELDMFLGNVTRFFDALSTFCGPARKFLAFVFNFCM